MSVLLSCTPRTSAATDLKQYSIGKIMSQNYPSVPEHEINGITGFGGYVVRTHSVLLHELGVFVDSNYPSVFHIGFVPYDCHVYGLKL